jgi:hypothetical protein
LPLLINFTKGVPVCNSIEHYDIKAYGGSGCIYPHFLNLGSKYAQTSLYFLNHNYKRKYAAVEVNLRVCSASAIDGCDWRESHCGSFAPEKESPVSIGQEVQRHPELACLKWK